MKVIAHKLRKHLAIIFAAAVCALVIFFVVNNPSLFQASILSLQEKAFMNEKKRDVAYKTNQWPFEIFIAEKHVYNTSDFEGILYFDPQKVQLDIENATGQGIFSINQASPESILVSIVMTDKIDSNRDIFAIPFSGEAQHIILGESRGKTKKWWIYFAVGNLNEFEQHGR